MIKEGTVINSKWKVKSFIARGGFGSVFLVKNIKNQSRAVIKVSNRHEDQHTIRREESLYKILNKKYPGSFATMLDYGYHGDICYIILEKLGRSLYDDINPSLGKKYSMKHVADIGIKIVESLKYMHDIGYLHLDIKPNNILYGSRYKYRNTPFLVDFGISTYFKDKSEGRGQICGTISFSSVRGNKGYNQCRVDDLESMMYTLVYLRRGYLPWQNEARLKKIIEMKQEMSSSYIFDDMPKEMVRIMSHILSLSFYEKPDYRYIKKKLLSIMNYY